MLSAVVQQSFDPSAVLEIVRRTIYEAKKHPTSLVGVF